MKICAGASDSFFQGRRPAFFMAIAILALFLGMPARLVCRPMNPPPGWKGEGAGVITISGAIGPITSTYVQRAIRFASRHNYLCLIIQLDTPGGLLNATKEIVEALYASPIPTIVYVTPAGASAASAGCFITMAADVAAMAPGTSIGAAHPVSIGTGGGENEGGEVMKQKLENFASSFIESIAARRHRNVQWAIASVRQSAAITAEKALDLKVIDCIAPSLHDLLAQLDGKTVNGRVLHTAGIEIRPIPMLVREKIFQRLWSPEVMYLLILIAMYGIIGELSNPGAILPAVAGSIALILALFMASILPVNATGAALLVLAVGLFVADIFVPTHGVLTVGGIIAFFAGSMMLFDTPVSAFHLSLALVIPATIISALFFIYIFGAGLRAQALPVRAGRETLIGKTARTMTPVTPLSGTIFLDGAYWNAVSASPIEEKTVVEIVKVEGLTLHVQPKPEEGKTWTT